MKKLLFLLLLISLSVLTQAQVIKIDIDSLFLKQNTTEIFSKRVAPGSDSFQIVAVKYQALYGVNESGNITIVIETSIDSTKGIRKRQRDIDDDFVKKRKAKQDEINLIDSQRPDLKPKITNKTTPALLIAEPPPSPPQVKKKK